MECHTLVLVHGIVLAYSRRRLRSLLIMEWVVKEKGTVETGTGKKEAMWNGSKDKSKLARAGVTLSYWHGEQK